MSNSTENSEPFDLLIQTDRMVCPKTGCKGPSVVAIRGDRIVAVGLKSSDDSDSAEYMHLSHSPALQKIRLTDGVLMPGLIDLHAHPTTDDPHYIGVDPDRGMLPSGVTTVMSQGDAGANNLLAYLEQVVDRSRARVLLAIHLSRRGETPSGSFADLADADVEACVQAIENHPQEIWGISVNASHNACGSTDPRLLVERGLAAARQSGLPLLYGMRRPEDWPLAEQLAQLRAGDVVTYCFRRRPHCIVDLDRKQVLPEVLDARQRGVLFDVGHGSASFDFEVAEIAIAAGFLPDTISTDLHRAHFAARPSGEEASRRSESDYNALLECHNLPLVMSKIQAAGMAEEDVWAAATSQPAKILRMESEIGSLKVGSCADLTALRLSSDPIQLSDAQGAVRCSRVWQAAFVVRAGRLQNSSHAQPS